MPTLYAISDELLALNAALEECGGEINAVPGLAEWFDRLAEDQGIKLDSYVNLTRQLDMEAAAARSEAEQWLAKAKARERNADSLRARLLDFLVRTGQPKSMTATGRVVAVQANGGRPPVELADSIDPAKLEARFVRYTAAVNKIAVAEALERGEELPFAKFGERGCRLKVS